MGLSLSKPNRTWWHRGVGIDKLCPYKARGLLEEYGRGFGRENYLFFILHSSFFITQSVDEINFVRRRFSFRPQTKKISSADHFLYHHSGTTVPAQRNFCFSAVVRPAYCTRSEGRWRQGFGPSALPMKRECEKILLFFEKELFGNLLDFN